MSTQRRLKYDSGSLAIYDVESTAIDDAPLSSPLSYVSRLHFHSALEYPAIIATYTGTVTLPALSADQTYFATYILAAHGRPGVPYVEGAINIGGVWVPLAGSVPVLQQSGNVNAASFARFLHLGADYSYIMLREYSISEFRVGFGGGSFNYVVYLTDRLVA